MRAWAACGLELKNIKEKLPHSCGVARAPLQAVTATGPSVNYISIRLGWAMPGPPIVRTTSFKRFAMLLYTSPRQKIWALYCHRLRSALLARHYPAPPTHAAEQGGLMCARGWRYGQRSWQYARKLASQSGDPVARKLVEYLYLTSSRSSPSFAEIASFLIANPSWPGLKGTDGACGTQFSVLHAAARTCRMVPPLSTLYGKGKISGRANIHGCR